MSGTDASEFEKVRSSERLVPTGFGNSERRKISELCQYCPNEDCPGCYQKNSKHACVTMKKWRNNQLDLVEAIRRKRNQNDRHEKTDEFREWVFEQVMREQLGYDWEEKADYSMKKDAGTFASRVAKGDDPYKADEGLWVHIPDSLARKISERQPDLDPPVSVGETYEVEIVDVGKEGDGLAKVSGFVVFVEDAEVGDELKIEITDVGDSVGFAEPK
jgi:predicted RNA-binding protein with TRAM domain